MKKILLSLLACSIVVVSFAQSIADINVPKVVPPSPEAAGLGKYGQMPVDKSTGIPSVSIPLYVIKTPRFSVPISLSYHASGVKVDELASWVGLGWSLNAGGVITRSMVGIADDYPGFGFLSDPMVKLSASTLMTGYLTHNFADSAYISQVSRNLEDSQPDNFFYNFGNQSGAFVYNNDNTKVPTLTPYKPLKITVNLGASAYQTTFTIVDESGNTYLFNNRELNTSNISDGMNAATSWYLTQMISADKSDTVKFYYTPPYTFIDQGYSFSQNMGPYASSTGLWPLAASINQINSQQIYVDSIVFKGGRVDFKGKTTARQDNGALALDSVIVSNYNFNSKKYTRLKSFKIGTDYFYSALPYANPWVSDPKTAYRLRLSSLTENDQNNVAVKTHQFAYNGTPPPTHSFAQDKWGFYNGKYGNQSLLEAQSIRSNSIYNGSGNVGYSSIPTTYVIGSGQGADRSIDTAAMRQGMLQKITYPTGGSTVFAYESNQGLAYPAAHDTTVQSFSLGAYHPADTIYFTPQTAMFGGPSGQVTFHIQVNKTSIPNGSGGYYFYSNSGSFVELMQGSTPVIYPQYANSSTNLDSYITVTLTAGTQYKLITSAIGGVTSQPTATLPQAHISTVYIVNGSPNPVMVPISGLRVKSIKSYDSNGSALSAETYKYGTGTYLTDPSLMVNVSQHLYVFSPETHEPSTVWETTYSNSSIYPLSSLNGSPMAYPSVTVYHGDTVNNIGKSVYSYAVTPDSLMIWSQVLAPVGLLTDSLGPNGNYLLNVSGAYGLTVLNRQGIRPVSRLWQNGEPVSESDYLNNGSGQYILQRSKSTTYKKFFRSGPKATFIAYGVEFSGINYTYSTQYWALNNFTLYDYWASSGSRVPVQTTTSKFATNGSLIATDTTAYAYDNLNHMFPTRIVSYNGKGDSILKQVQYPQDMPQTGIYGSMTATNIVSPVIQFTQSKNYTKSGGIINVGTSLMQSVTNYAMANGVINPSNVQLKVGSNPIETRLSYLNYDSYGNVATVAKTGGVPISYIWGYRGTYPVAEAKNAKVNDIFYESFEDGHGNTGNGDAKTGHYSFLGTYYKPLSSLDNGAYLLTYWSKSGNVWTMVTTPVTVSAGSYSINLTGQVDDIRFYPASTQMTSYTYDPLVGVTSSTDAKGEIMYYQYDSLQRLQNIRDQNNNIVKSFCYNYAGQATNCFINQPSYSSAARDSIFTRNCGAGYTGSAVHYILAAGSFTSNISQADANNMAKNDVIANAQNYANLYGSCTQNTIGFTMSNTTGAAGIQVTFYGATNYTFTIPPSGSSTVQILPGTYSSMTVGPTSPSHTFTLGTRTPITNTIAGFSNVNISTGSSDLTLSVH